MTIVLGSVRYRVFTSHFASGIVDVLVWFNFKNIFFWDIQAQVRWQVSSS